MLTRINELTRQLRQMSPCPAAIVGTLLYGASSLSHAQPTEGEGLHERWYQVEVIVFAQQQPQSSEIWYNNPSLRYPEAWQSLKNADEPVELPGIPEPASINSGEAPQLMGDTVSSLNQNPVNSGYPLLASSGNNLVLADASRAADLARDPFYRLPDEMRELNPQAQAIRWSKAYRLLFHEAWRQPIKNQTEAPGILLSGGEQYGDHFELEGSLTLSVSRYLHVNTNLWFTEFAMNNGQQEDYWPDLPLRPDAFKTNTPAQSLSLVQSEDEHQSAQALTLAANGTLGVELPVPSHSSESQAAVSEAWPNSQPEQPISGSSIDILLSQLPGNEAYERLINQPFKPRQIVLMQQKRRMRSGETHYIDHPYLGLLILITPYDVPEQTDSAMADTTSGSEPTGQTVLGTGRPQASLDASQP